MISIRRQRGFLALSALALLGACVLGRQVGEHAVTLAEPFETVSAASLPPMLGLKIAALAKIDPSHLADDNRANQVLSLFGREDLIAASSDDYRSTGCAALPSAKDVLAEIEARARRTPIVIVNESHERSRHRGFIAEIAERLRVQGYDSLAMEALSNPPTSTPESFQERSMPNADVAFTEDGHGYYVSEAGFGRLARLAKLIGYRFIPYEMNQLDEPAPGTTRAEQIAAREEAQARNLANFLIANPRAKLLVHVGYSHARETMQLDGTQWMASRLKAKTGVDPLTISQTTCRGGGESVRLSAPPPGEIDGSFDLVVDHPRETFVRGRPEWRLLAGDIATDIPAPLRPERGWRIIEARPIGESSASVPMDRVAIRPGEDIALMLPPGRYQVRAIDIPLSIR